jgi:eukaryotic-like serine/threonine-protein kinase
MPDGSGARRLVAVLCGQFEEDWKGGRPTPLENVLSGAPVEIRPDLFRELLLLERDYRGRAGRPVTEEEARRRFEDLGAWAAEAIDEAFPIEAAVVLDAVAGPYAGKSFALAGHATFTIGRQVGLQVSLPDDGYLSRAHCLIEVNLPLARVVDLGSKSGTFVNGQRVRQKDLRDGDEIRAGSTTLKVHIASAVGAGTLSLPQVGSASGSSVETQPHVSGYRLEEEVGRGAMGVVYRARREATGEVVAVKTLLPAVPAGQVAMRRFLREADILRQLDHPNIVRFEHAGTARGTCYFVMEYVDGTDAKRLLAKGPGLAPERVLTWAGQILDALAHAHDRGFVHRDIKPSNLLVVGPATSETIKISDFGLARAYEASSMSGLTVANESGGTPEFMPPEQVTDFRHARPTADQYAVAATLYYLLTGQKVYEPGKSVQEMLLRIMVEDPIPLRPGALPLPGRFDMVLRKALARSPNDRYPGVREMRRVLCGG